ncbi:MAG TPA: PAS domain-containing protein [Candidatus Saccharimonadales bacterium]|nr:PAS domain-containing protein [Candidatus Saccharimonadales bacterium]
MDGHNSSLVYIQYLSTVFDNIADGILLINIEGPNSYRLSMANKPYFAFSGYPEDSVGKKLPEFLTGESYTFLSRQFRKVIKTKKTVDYTRWADMPSGLRAINGRLVPIFSTTGECIQIAAILHDCTEQEQLREEVGHLRDTVRGIRSSI